MVRDGCLTCGCTTRGDKVDWLIDVGELCADFERERKRADAGRASSRPSSTG
jgi:hypothetical protein